MSEIWNVIKIRGYLRANNLQIEKGLVALLKDNDDDPFAKYKAEALQPEDTDAHLRWIDTVLTSDDSVVKGYLDHYDTPEKRAASKDHQKLDGTLLLVAMYRVINGEWFFDYHHEILGAAGPVMAVGLSWVTITLVQFIAEVTQHNRIRRRFSSYGRKRGRS